ncbi:hypothetical protein ACIOWK_32745 [Pseudomonas protegens]|uniref:hypothetical protein n=1 Tax=Pseudomonas protegens TaxID=380021 RepID=UPI0038062FEB
MRGLIIIALLILAGHATAGEQVISVQHDSQRGVTCWILNNTGISCLPDSVLNPRQGTATTTPESETVRAATGIAVGQNEQLPTTTTPGAERFQL